MREFGFEMALCAVLEAEGRLVARQLGASTRGRRVVDVVVVEPGPEFEARTRLTPHTIPSLALGADADVGVGRYRYWRDCFDCHPDRAREVVGRCVDIGFYERTRRNGREYVRQVARYPDWFGRLRGFENKPDLGAPGDLEVQLRKDVSLGVLDEIVLCTGSYVTGAHLNRLPDEVGVWRFDADAATYEVVREPTPLDSAGPGIEVVTERPARTEIAVVDAAANARLRRAIAERAYGKGWRVAFPDCPHVENHSIAGVDGVPYCTRTERVVGSSDPCDCVAPSGAEGGTADRDGADDSPGARTAVDLAAIRNRQSPWVRDPVGRRRRQSGLDRFS